ncbi:hypothetical protein BGZ95_010951 [Linnemannia exigua]|uniref:Uncharacterized protein n=1 Tax=Linnemannia exigua TaxID=604196 RepID=A0AAD4H9B0_9FUNG|nr:hypothetical protein BGZ95_010951 [Linnemannia exigua]
MATELQNLRQGQDGPTVQLRAEFDQESGKHLIFWEDVEFAFPGVHCLKSGSTIVSFARDKRKRIEPLCIEYEPDVVLDVVMAATPSVPTTSALPSPFPSPASLTSADTRYEDKESTARITEIDSSTTEYIEYPFPSSKNNHAVDTTGSPSYHVMDPPPIPARPHVQDKSYAPSIRAQSDLTTRFSAPPSSTLSALTTIAAVETTNNSIITSGRFMQRLQSTALSFEQSIREGQITQAKFLKQEADSIKQEMSVYYEGLHSEMLEMQAAADKMTKRILQLQEAATDNDKRMLEMQQKALDRLALIHSKAAAILLQTYELHEYPIPRLFIILPKEDTTRREKLTTLFVKRFRLYFLCECGDHTKPNDGSESKMSHEIHLARHEGYDLDRPNEFFRKYGSYVLALLQMLKYGVAAAGMVVSPLHSFKICEGLDDTEKALKYLQGDIVPMVDDAIKYLEGLTSVQEGTTTLPEGGVSNAPATTLAEPVIMNKLEALEGADLRHLRSFLKSKDDAKVLGNLYRTVTLEGHVKWVCLDHYRETYRASALKEFRNNLEANNGQYDDRSGRVTIKLSSTLLSQQFYNILANTRFVQELFISLAWDTSLEDFRILKSVIQRSIIYHLDIDACGFSGSTFDIVNRGRRWEPVLQMMGNGKLGIVAVRNMPGFLLRSGKIPGMLQMRVLDMSDQLTSTEEYPRLRKLLLASPNLSELSLLVPSICDGFDLVRQLAGDLKQLSALLLKQQDGSMANVSFMKSSRGVTNIELSICTNEARRIFQLPMVTALSFFGDSTKNADTIQMALKSYRQLKTLDLTCTPQDFMRVLSFVYQNIDKGTSLTTISLRNAERDIVVTSHNLPVTDIDFGAYVVPIKSFDALGSLLSACVQLETLAFITPSLTYGIELVRGIRALRGTLRNLTVGQPNWSRVDVLFVPGAGEMESIKLRICDIESPKLLALPSVKKVSIFSKDRGSKSAMDRDFGYLLHSIISSYPHLETLELLDMDTASEETIKAFLQTAKDFSVSQGSPTSESQSKTQDVQVRKPSPCSLVVLPEEYVVLGNAFEAVRWITTMPLIISSADMSTTSVDDFPRPASPTFAVKRYNGSIASIRIDLDTDHGSPLLLHVCDFASGDSFAPTSGSSMTIINKRDTQFIDDLILVATKRCQGLGTLAVVFLYQNLTYPSFLKMLGTVHEAALQRPTLRAFKDWGLVNGNRMATFDIPVTYLDTTRQSFTVEDMPIFDQLFKSCAFLTELIVLAHRVWEAYVAIKKASLVHKRLSRLHLRHQMGLARASILIEQETGAVIDIRLTIRSSIPPKIFLLPKVTTLVIEAGERAEGLEALVLEGLGMFHEARTLEIKSPTALFFSSLLAVQKAMLNRYALTRIEIWGLVDNNTKFAFDLPLTQLDLSQRLLYPSELPLLTSVLEVSPAIKDLTLLVQAIHEALDTLQKTLKRLKARTALILTLSCPDGSGAFVEIEETGGHIISVDLRLPKDTLNVPPTTHEDSFYYEGSLTAVQSRQLLELPDDILRTFDIIQRATINNPFLTQANMLNGDLPPIIYNIPILRLSIDHWTLSVKDDFPKASRVLRSCFGLRELDLLVPAINEAFTASLLMVQDARYPSQISTITIRQSDGARATISFKDPVEGLHTVSVTLQLPRAAAAPTSLDDTAPLAQPFSILRMSNEVFGTLVAALDTVLVDLYIHQIDITDTTNIVLTSFVKPIRILDFGPVAVTKEDLPRLKSLLELTMRSLHKLELSAYNLDDNLHFILRALKVCKIISSFIIKREDGAKALFDIQPNSGDITFVVLQLPQDSSSTSPSSLGQRGMGGFHYRRTAITGDDGILQLKDLMVPELRFFAFVQQLTNLRPDLCIFYIKDPYDDFQRSIAVPVLKVNLPSSLSEEGLRVVERLLAHCPLLSEASVTVDNLESAVIPFVKELPEQLRELSRLSIRQVRQFGHDTMVSFFKQTDKSTMETTGIQQFEGIKIQTYTLLPTSNLLELKHVKELTLLSSFLNDSDAFVFPDEGPEIMTTVATVMTRFPELQRLEIQCLQMNFGSLKSSLAALSETGLGLRFDLYLTDGVNVIQFLRGGSGTQQDRHQHLQQQPQLQKQKHSQQQPERVPVVVDTSRLPAHQANNTEAVCSIIKRQPVYVTKPQLTHLIIRDWKMSPFDWDKLLHSIDYLTLRHLSFPESNFGYMELQVLVKACRASFSEWALEANLLYHEDDKRPSEEDTQALSDLKAQQLTRKQGGHGGLTVYLGGSCVTAAMASVQQANLRTLGVNWCHFTMEEGPKEEWGANSEG